MYFQDLLTATDIRQWNNDLAIKTARTLQRRVKYIRTVGCCDHNNGLVAFKTIHFNQQLVQCLLTLIIATAQTGTTLTADSINFINKDDTWRIFLSLLEHIADTARTDTDKHFYEVRT